MNRHEQAMKALGAIQQNIELAERISREFATLGDKASSRQVADDLDALLAKHGYAKPQEVITVTGDVSIATMKPITIGVQGAGDADGSGGGGNIQTDVRPTLSSIAASSAKAAAKE